jgi:eukaryotic-like serine/threonine-protein kinase
MHDLLQTGELIRTESTQLDCKVESLLGAGSQGEVYRTSLGGRPMALKWYLPQNATAQQRAALEALVRKGPPNSRFLWPLELASRPGLEGFGYVMPLRDRRFHSLVDLMKRRIDPPFRALATAGFQLADSFLQLHSKGLCYRDISFGNLFLEPSTGEVLICDNDNVAIDGARATGVLGTPRFMAPEIVRGEASPSTQTDLFSLAVLLFYLFVVHHPLEGRRELAIHSFDLAAMNELYGRNPLFIFDPRDRSNEPVQGHHDNALYFWPLYPAFFQDLFIRSFTAGLRDASHGRVRETEWRAATLQLRDCIVYCHNCGTENFGDFSQHRAPICWSCNHRVHLPFHLIIGKSRVFLNHDTELFPHHTSENTPWDFSAAIARVNQHPSEPGKWGLKNLSANTWFLQKSGDAELKPVPPGRSATLSVGAKIYFSKSEALIGS